MLKKMVIANFILSVCLIAPSGLRAQDSGFAYVTGGGLGCGIYAYVIDGSAGALNPVPGSPFSSDCGGPVVLDPARRFAYEVNPASGAANSGSISAYSIDGNTGALSPVAGSPFPDELGPVSLAVESTGRFAYVANSNPNGVSAYRIKRESGALKIVPASPFPGQGSGVPRAMAADPMGQFVYVAVDLGAGRGQVSGYRIDKGSGALSVVPGSPFPTEHFPFSIAVDSSGAFAYVTCGQRVGGEPNPTISAYSIDRKTGALTQAPGSPYDVAFPPLSVTATPSGRFVYVAASLANAISAYTVDNTTGALTSPTGFVDSGAPRSVAVDPSGQFLYAADSDAFRISIYSIDNTTGALTLLSVASLPTGFSPGWITTQAAPDKCRPENSIGTSAAVSSGELAVLQEGCKD